MDAKRLSLEEQQILQQFEKGRLLHDTTVSPGWQLVLDCMEKEVAEAEFQLMNYNGTDKEALVALHRRARTKREFFQNIQLKISTLIEAAAQVPAVADPQRVPVEEW